MNKQLLKIRKSLGLTQKEFGEKIGCSRDRIANIELGRVEPGDLLISHMCDIYNVSDVWLRTSEGEMFRPIEDDLYYLFGENADDLTDNMIALFKVILKLSDEKRKMFDEFLGDFITEYNKIKDLGE